MLHRFEKSLDERIWEAALLQVHGREDAIPKELGEAEIKDSR